MLEEILTEIETLFNQRLEAKNGWGKNEIQMLYKECQLDVLKKHIGVLLKNEK